MVETSFQTFWFLLKNSNFNLTKYCSLGFFPLEMMSPPHLFFWNILPNTQVQKTLIYISVVLPSKHDVPWQKVASSACNTNNCMRLFLKTITALLYFSMQPQCFMHTSHFVTQNVKNMIFKCQDLTILTISTASTWC